MADFSLQPLSANLPPNPVGEDDLQASFRASATSIVELLRAGQRTRQRAYHAGMSAALDDVVSFLQQELDRQQPDRGFETLLNYIEARQAALRAVESDDSEDERPQAGPSRHRSLAPERRADSPPPHRRALAEADELPTQQQQPSQQQQHNMSPGPRTRSQTLAPSSPVSQLSDMPSSVFTFDCPPPRSASKRSGSRQISARAVVLEAAASVAGVKRGLPTIDDAIDVRMDDEDYPTRPSKRMARR